LILDKKAKVYVGEKMIFSTNSAEHKKNSFFMGLGFEKNSQR
jgi:hypothetical protein